ncbi:Hint domain-containing protein [Pacificibacter maritimus]|uniref:Hint domain-containing protein n=1 Tax=Pacificibacter maritimus TaxID=762213 RepID=A0A3N4UTY6_9RHOB|nr:Hint domain-containing protein [Pacificibacter maritimus]RPE70949.1 Hint domain-containing protein [Pacificibacter maritimus]
MVDVTRTVIRLGNFSDGIADIDPDGTGSAENAAALVNQTFTGATMSVETITYSDGDNDGFIDYDGTVGSGGDYIIYDFGGGPVSETMDQGVWYDIDILLGDGSTFSTNALIFQTPSGETFLNEFSTSLDNLDIQSITPTAVKNAYFSRTATSESVDNTTVCFARGTEILTPDGLRLVEDFRPGNEVLTTDGKAQKVIAVYRVPADSAGTNPPVRFESGSLGHNMPSKPLTVTANHRMLCASRLTFRMFGKTEVLIPAIRFVGLCGVDTCSASSQLEFFHLQLEIHSVICANGAFAESCLLGPVAVQSLPRVLRNMTVEQDAHALRYPVPSGHKQRQFMCRLAKNSHSVIERQVAQHYSRRIRDLAPAII